MQLKLNKIKVKVWSLFNEKKRTSEFYEFIDPKLVGLVSKFYQDDYMLSTPIDEEQIKFTGINDLDKNHYLIRRIIPNPVEVAVLIPDDMGLKKMMLYTNENFSRKELIICNINLDHKMSLICEVQISTHATQRTRKNNRFQKKYCVIVKILEHFSSDYYLYKNLFSKNIKPNEDLKIHSQVDKRI